MCLAILKTRTAVVPEEILWHGWNENPDGAGFAWPHNGKIEIVKGLMSFDEFWEAYEPVSRLELPVMVHFRVATHGPVIRALTHPFRIGRRELAMIHNGTIGGLPLFWKESDTLVFARKKLPRTTRRYPMLPRTLKRLGMRIGWSRMVFLDGAGRWQIANEHKGFWDDGVWYSNGSAHRSLEWHNANQEGESDWDPTGTAHDGKDAGKCICCEIPLENITATFMAGWGWICPYCARMFLD